MSGKRKIRETGKLQLSRYFQEISIGDSVAVKKNLAVQSHFPNRIQGRTGIVLSKSGRAYLIKIKDLNKEKKFIIAPIHLKKIQTQKAQ